jgi:hypothetical protein
MQENRHKVFMVPAVVFSCLLTLYGLAAVRGMDLRQDALLSVTYCVLPFLSLPLYLAAFGLRKLLPFQAILLFAYIAVYSALNWRTCTELGYCGSVVSVVLVTIKTSKVMLFWGVALSSAAAFVVEECGRGSISNENIKR